MPSDPPKPSNLGFALISSPVANLNPIKIFDVNRSHNISARTFNYSPASVKRKALLSALDTFVLKTDLPGFAGPAEILYNKNQMGFAGPVRI